MCTAGGAGSLHTSLLKLPRSAKKDSAEAESFFDFGDAV